MPIEFEAIDKCKCNCHYSPNVIHCFPCCGRTYYQYKPDTITEEDYKLYELLFPQTSEKEK